MPDVTIGSREAIQLHAIAIRFLISCSVDLVSWIWAGINYHLHITAAHVTNQHISVSATSAQNSISVCFIIGF